MKNRFEIISRSLSKGRGFGTQEEQAVWGPFPFLHRILCACMMHTLTAIFFHIYEAHVEIKRCFFYSIFFCEFLGFQRPILSNQPASPIES